MEQQDILFDPSEPAEALTLGAYAERAYLDYAISVVKGRALPEVADGQKPVQRRILFAMHEMGLRADAKPVKSARVVGDVLGKYHPHGDQSAYDALVRLAQDFSLRYPLIDGQGNFGSRDGDGAAAMRYTEARLTPISRLLLEELDQGTVDFVPNYDGSMEEPKLLPARLPFVLLNGASGIAVGMATEIPSHNLREVANAAVALIRDDKLTSTDLMQYMPGPDFPGGGQIISSATDIAQVYETGRGSLKVRARWKIEDLARGQWQLVVTELPPNTSSQKVLEEIEELTNPKVRAGKKSLSPDQLQMKQTMLGLLDAVRDESGKDAPVRLVFEPKSKNIDQQEFANALLAHTSLESGAAINLVMIGMDGRPRQKGLAEILREWISYRFATVTRRTRHRLGKVEDRIHILEGRQMVLLRIEEVIRIIRESDEPKAALIQAFNLTERQAEDILEIRLRQLARLEAIKIEQELKSLREEQADLDVLLKSETMMRRRIIKEIETDAKQYGDDRRTLIQEERRAAAEVKVIDEPVTVIVSQKGWVRTRQGHGHDATQFGFKAGDALYDTFECRTTDALLIFGTRDDKGTGRVYSVAVANLPGGRGDGVPLTTLIELAPGTHIAHTFAGNVEQNVLISTRGGNGFMAKVGDMVGRQKAGKAFLTLDEGDQPNKPAPVPADAYGVACLSANGRLLLFPIAELKTLSSGGRGVILMELEKNETLAQALAFGPAGFVLTGAGPRGGKVSETTMTTRAQEPYAGKRARKGKVLEPKLRDPKLSLPKPAPEAA
ncbi:MULTISPECIES: DNA topoisomerase IV subunit A [Ralstonia]|uniref:DNA topoisomerase IV subunit A n=1 Tax=Ralstonia TaxID=48736 RepID=UPI0005D9E204|nr:MULTISPECIES: DNA topoisomerase IV subunit A [Ralstonia]AJW44842.1 DNA topoisomerase IV subunit A [Ralstonia mannitolilytica]MBU9578736.1 DNA topoisomerase IV subunit A [Ralstonia mannitolilytica]PLT18590.1 DNA topoisomerase IV subunit A [Ralstonia mannitolilytica]QIF07005.1 DNA topoisomerase IV subunit A [Ralstonia mannitolilytica]CAJ0727202.1 DNA topoisomerase 4 subunit A [Ralstonia mannitolilytica]